MDGDSVGGPRNQNRLLVRVINLDRIKQYKIQEIVQEARQIVGIQNQTSQLLQIEGIYFNEKEQTLSIYMPQRVSLYSILHESKHQLRSIEKLIIAKKIAKALFQIQMLHQQA